MKFVTVSGPPSSGKTSVLLAVIEELSSLTVGVLKFDCLSTGDDRLYEQKGAQCRIGLSGSICPDHYFVSNIEACIQWGIRQKFDLLISESAGLCNRCSPHIEGVLSVCVIDNLMGVNTPQKIGPMLKMADIVVVTKGDIVSQAEREIFSFKIIQANPTAEILQINGISGQGADRLSRLIQNAVECESLFDQQLRASMPSALCSYCLGQVNIGNDKQLADHKKMKLDPVSERGQFK